jgi:hypothetical protein
MHRSIPASSCAPPRPRPAKAREPHNPHPNPTLTPFFPQFNPMKPQPKLNNWVRFAKNLVSRFSTPQGMAREPRNPNP